MAYGVTDFADGFVGALGVGHHVDGASACHRHAPSRGRLDARLLRHNHLEPSHDAAVRAAAEGLRASVASLLTKRWARTLSDEFKRGACHAGPYETSLALAAGARVDGHRELPAMETSVSREIAAGKTRFREMGLDRAHTGAPAEATVEEGDEMYARLVAMIVREVTDGVDSG